MLVQALRQHHHRLLGSRLDPRGEKDLMWWEGEVVDPVLELLLMQLDNWRVRDESRCSCQGLYLSARALQRRSVFTTECNPLHAEKSV